VLKNGEYVTPQQFQTTLSKIQSSSTANANNLALTGGTLTGKLTVSSGGIDVTAGGIRTNAISIATKDVATQEHVANYYVPLSGVGTGSNGGSVIAHTINTTGIVNTGAIITDSLTVNSSDTDSGTLTVTGAITANGGITVAANQNLILNKPITMNSFVTPTAGQI
jgi:hypothetical protein